VPPSRAYLTDDRVIDVSISNYDSSPTISELDRDRRRLLVIPYLLRGEV
jgi:hypothetical protein